MHVAVNQRRLAEIMLQHCNQIEERCPGYRSALVDAVIQVLELENVHRSGGGINIRQKIGDQCEAVGSFLAERREKVGE